MARRGSASTRAEHVYELLRRDIIFGRLSPGSRLSPGELAAQLGTSSTVVRDALMQLSAERLAERRPTRGFAVPQLSLEELSDLTRVRIHNDTLALSLAIERGGLEWETEVLSALHRLRSTHRRTSEDPEHTTEEWSSRHREFHLSLLSGCQIPLLLDLARTMFDSMELYRRWSAPSEAASHRDVDAEHAALVEATLARDSVSALQLLDDHYSTTLQVILESGLVSATVI